MLGCRLERALWVRRLQKLTAMEHSFLFGALFTFVLSQQSCVGQWSLTDVCRRPASLTPYTDCIGFSKWQLGRSPGSVRTEWENLQNVQGCIRPFSQVTHLPGFWEQDLSSMVPH